MRSFFFCFDLSGCTIVERISLFSCFIFVAYRPAVFGSRLCVIINFVMSKLKKLIMMQKLEARAGSLKATKIGPMDW